MDAPISRARIAARSVASGAPSSWSPATCPKSMTTAPAENHNESASRRMTEEAGRARNRVQPGCTPAVTPIADPQTRDWDPKHMSDGHVSRISPTTDLILFSQVSKYFWRFLDIKPRFHRVPVHTNLSLCSKGATPGYRSTEGHRGSHSRLTQRAYADFDTGLIIDSERSCARRLRSVSASAPKV